MKCAIATVLVLFTVFELGTTALSTFGDSAMIDGQRSTGFSQAFVSAIGKAFAEAPGVRGGETTRSGSRSGQMGFGGNFRGIDDSSAGSDFGRQFSGFDASSMRLDGRGGETTRSGSLSDQMGFGGSFRGIDDSGAWTAGSTFSNLPAEGGEFGGNYRQSSFGGFNFGGQSVQDNSGFKFPQKVEEAAINFGRISLTEPKAFGDGKLSTAGFGAGEADGSITLTGDAEIKGDLNLRGSIEGTANIKATIDCGTFNCQQQPPQQPVQASDIHNNIQLPPINSYCQRECSQHQSHLGFYGSCLDGCGFKGENIQCNRDCFRGAQPQTYLNCISTCNAPMVTRRHYLSTCTETCRNECQTPWQQELCYPVCSYFVPMDHGQYQNSYSLHAGY